MASIKIKPKTGIINYEEHVGDTLIMAWNWTAPDANNIQRQVNLSGYDCKVQVKAVKTDDIPLLYFTSNPANGITLGGTSNNIEIEISAANTANLGIGTFYYDCQMTDTLGRVNTLVEGTIKLLQDTTR